MYKFIEFSIKLFSKLYMAISKQVCVASTALGILVSALVVGLCTWFVVPGK